jgi:hypothetical protein
MSMRKEFPSSAESQIPLKFLKDSPSYDESKPYYVSGLLPHHQEVFRTNIEYEILSQSRLYDLRGYERQLSIDRHGFEIIDIPSNTVSLDVRGSQKLQYMEMMTELARETLGGSFALCYDCRVS